MCIVAAMPEQPVVPTQDALLQAFLDTGLGVDPTHAVSPTLKASPEALRYPLETIRQHLSRIQSLMSSGGCYVRFVDALKNVCCICREPITPR